MTFYGSSQQLTWQFANYQVVNSGTQLQFDVEVQANAAGTYQRDLQVYFNYNTAGFGSNLVANGHITITPMDLMSSFYFVVNTADNTSSKVAVITEATNEMTQPGSATYYNEMPTTYTPLFRVTMDVASNTATAGIDFDAALMNGGQYYQSTSNTDPLKYTDPCLYNNDLLSLTLSSLYGTLTYANTSSTVMNGSSVDLYQGATLIGSTVSDAAGMYNFTGINDGAYTYQTSSTKPWGGVTAIDVLFAKRFIGTIITLTPLQQKAGDVNEASGITAIDILFIKRRIAGITVSQWTAPDFVFEDVTGTVTSGLGTQSYQCLCSGDVNSSYVPPTE
jgi:hypothetical protein